MTNTKAPTLPTRQEVAEWRETAVHADPPHEEHILALCALIEAQERLLEEAVDVIAPFSSCSTFARRRAFVSKLDAHRDR